MVKVEIPFPCEITEDCNIQINSKFKYRMLSHLKGKDLTLYLSERKASKTTRQNSFWWGVIIKTIIEWLKETTGTAPTPQLLHVHICSRILDIPLTEVVIEGHTYLDAERFKLSKAGIGDVSEAIETVIAHYAAKGVVFPEPADYLK